MYSLLKPMLFKLDPETAHHLALTSLACASKLNIFKLASKQSSNPVSLMGLQFPNLVGLAAGFDKNGDYIDALPHLGFGFIEIGTVTPTPQSGNPKPRLFRLAEQSAIINRMGFNNKGMDYVAKRLEQTKYRGILGINIGKNKDTPEEHASDDYLQAFRTLWPYASYITINISSPNTPGLRNLQHGDQFKKLLCVLKQEQHSVLLNHKRYVPLVVKIAPDLSDDELAMLAQIILKEKMDAVIATNTTLSRQGVEASPYAKEAGGLSGRPLQALSTSIIKKLSAQLNNQIPIIASGGVMDAASAQEKIAAGASLVQVYSGLIYAGPGIIKEICTLRDGAKSAPPQGKGV